MRRLRRYPTKASQSSREDCRKARRFSDPQDMSRNHETFEALSKLPMLVRLDANSERQNHEVETRGSVLKGSTRMKVSTKPVSLRVLHGSSSCSSCRNLFIAFLAVNRISKQFPRIRHTRQVFLKMDVRFTAAE
jgi:hypothetical protein